MHALRRDLYGNSDPLPAAAACEAARAAGRDLSCLPEPYRSFYRARAVSAMDQALSQQQLGSGLGSGS